MIFLYCYHSPESSSVGFQKAGWAAVDGRCASFSKGHAEVWELLLNGECKALLLDTTWHTKLFLLRDIHETETGWHLNFALETDEKDFAAWSGLVCRVMEDYTNFLREFGALFSVQFTGGEHYQLNKGAFLHMLETNANEKNLNALRAYLSQLPASSFKHQLSGLIASLSIFELRPTLLRLLVISAKAHSFYKKCGIPGISKYRLCIEESLWTAILTHSIDTAELVNRTKQVSPDVHHKWKDVLLQNFPGKDKL